MHRIVVQLVRTSDRSESMRAVLGAASAKAIDAAKPSDLWLLLEQQGISPEEGEEVDMGVEMFSTHYDAGRDAHLPVIVPLAPARCQPADQPIPPGVNRARLPPKGARTTRRVVTLSRSVERYEVMRAVVEVPDLVAFEEIDASDLWDRCLGEGVPVEADEYLWVETDIEIAPYKAEEHEHLPLVTLQGETASEDDPPMDFSSRWQPSVEAGGKDEGESRRVAKAVGVEANACYTNARKVIRSLPEYSEATYVEGFVVTHDGECFEHGWIVKGGTIIDPTLPHDGNSYFAGVEFAGRGQIRAFLSTKWGRKQNGSPFHPAFGWNPGLDSPSFLRAFELAVRHLSDAFGYRAVDCAIVVRAREGLPWSDDWR